MELQLIREEKNKKSFFGYKNATIIQYKFFNKHKSIIFTASYDNNTSKLHISNNAILRIFKNSKCVYHGEVSCVNSKDYLSSPQFRAKMPQKYLKYYELFKAEVSLMYQ